MQEKNAKLLAQFANVSFQDGNLTFTSVTPELQAILLAWNATPAGGNYIYKFDNLGNSPTSPEQEIKQLEFIKKVAEQLGQGTESAKGKTIVQEVLLAQHEQHIRAKQFINAADCMQDYAEICEDGGNYSAAIMAYGRQRQDLEKLEKTGENVLAIVQSYIATATAEQNAQQLEQAGKSLRAAQAFLTSQWDSNNMAGSQAAKAEQEREIVDHMWQNVQAMIQNGIEIAQQHEKADKPELAREQLKRTQELLEEQWELNKLDQALAGGARKAKGFLELQIANEMVNLGGSNDPSAMEYLKRSNQFFTEQNGRNEVVVGLTEAQKLHLLNVQLDLDAQYGMQSQSGVVGAASAQNEVQKKLTALLNDLPELTDSTGVGELLLRARACLALQENKAPVEWIEFEKVNTKLVARFAPNAPGISVADRLEYARVLLHRFQFEKTDALKPAQLSALEQQLEIAYGKRADLTNQQKLQLADAFEAVGNAYKPLIDAALAVRDTQTVKKYQDQMQLAFNQAKEIRSAQNYHTANTAVAKALTNAEALLKMGKPQEAREAANLAIKHSPHPASWFTSKADKENIAKAWLIKAEALAHIAPNPELGETLAEFTKERIELYKAIFKYSKDAELRLAAVAGLAAVAQGETDYSIVKPYLLAITTDLSAMMSNVQISSDRKAELLLAILKQHNLLSASDNQYKNSKEAIKLTQLLRESATALTKQTGSRAINQEDQATLTPFCSAQQATASPVAPATPATP